MRFLEVLAIVLLVGILMYWLVKALINKIKVEHIGDREKEYTMLSAKITNVDDTNNSKLDNKNERIIFLGDSITELFLVNEYFPGHNVFNRGISGDTTGGVLQRISSNVYPLKPTKIFLLIGTNDLRLKLSAEALVERILNIVKEIKTNCSTTKIFVQSIYPVIEHRLLLRFNKDINKINEILSSKLNEMNVEYIDINSSLKDETGNLKSEYTDDGLHLTHLGYVVVSEIIKRYI